MRRTTPLNLLIAYPYLRDRDLDWLGRQECGSFRLLVDSGAFTAHQQGSTIDVRDYIAFLKAMPFEPWRYFSLDVIGDPEATRSNHQRMLDAGLSPIPVWTTGQDLDELEALFETAEVVGFGGLVGSRGHGNQGNARWRVQQGMAKAKGRLTHWLGYACPPLMRSLRPYSVDTSSWRSGTRYGILRLYAGNGVWKDLHAPTRKGIGDAVFRRPKESEARLLLSYGIRCEELLLPSFWRSSGRLHEITTRAYLRFMVECEANGTHLFFANTFVPKEAFSLDA